MGNFHVPAQGFGPTLTDLGPRPTLDMLGQFSTEHARHRSNWARIGQSWRKSPMRCMAKPGTASVRRRPTWHLAIPAPPNRSRDARRTPWEQCFSCYVPLEIGDVDLLPGGRTQIRDVGSSPNVLKEAGAREAAKAMPAAGSRAAARRGRRRSSRAASASGPITAAWTPWLSRSSACG